MQSNIANILLIDTTLASDYELLYCVETTLTQAVCLLQKSHNKNKVLLLVLILDTCSDWWLATSIDKDSWHLLWRLACWLSLSFEVASASNSHQLLYVLRTVDTILPILLISTLTVMKLIICRQCPTNWEMLIRKI